VALNDPHYFLRRNSLGEVHLSLSHQYYHQVQGQMLVTLLQYCDFVCWTTSGVFVERINFDNDYSQLIPSLEDFFKRIYIIPELLTHKLLHSLTTTVPATSASSSQPTHDVNDNGVSSSYAYCYCRNDIGGRMICCDNESCCNKWYHYTCVGIKRAPKGVWYCADCKHSI
jgi:hypothetical protein